MFLALSLLEASVEVPSGDPIDDAGDGAVGGVWVGGVPPGEVAAHVMPTRDLEPGVAVQERLLALKAMPIA